MQRQSSLLSLSQDVKVLILEYIPLSNYSRLALVCRDFNHILSTRPDLWTNYLFKNLLENTQRDIMFMEEEAFSLIFNSKRRGSKCPKNAQRLLIDSFQIKLRWKSFFENLMVSKGSKNLLNSIFEEFRSPSYPLPCLKKDVHHFPTNTLFQNFLTEVHFEVQGRSFFPDKIQAIIQNVARQIEDDQFSSKTNTDDLVELRWYLFKQREEKRKNTDNPLSIRASELTNRTKVAKNKKSSTQSLTLMKDYGLSNQLTPSKEPVHSLSLEALRIGSKKKATKVKGASYKKHEIIGELAQNLKESSSYVEEFYWMLHSLIENYCHTVLAHLKHIKDPYLLLCEYTRLWNRFVLLTINFSRMFIPLDSLFNKYYEEECSDLPNFPEFSTWRLMMKVWIDQVFSNLNCCLNQSFRVALMRFRNSSKSPLVKNQKNSSRIDFRFNKDELEDLNDCHFSKLGEMSAESYELVQHNLANLLKGFYQTISDISYNEYTVFYWDCSPAGKETPKGVLDALILQDSKLFYNYCRDQFYQHPDELKQCLFEDIKVVENIAGKLLVQELRAVQALLINQIICEMLNDASINYSAKYSSNTDEMLINRELYTGEMTANLDDREGVSKTYLSYLLEVQKDVELQSMELEEMNDHRYLRGFMLADERYNNFTELTLTPSLKEIELIGSEGRNIKEELECLNDKIIFL